jgi:hypothetical protein
VKSQSSTLPNLRRSFCAMRLQALTSPPLLALIASLVFTTPAHAIDGCRVMLCLAAPKWREVPLCVPTINELMKHLARGRPFPICKGGGPDNGADNIWATAPRNCPVQYIFEVDGPNGPRQRCKYIGAVEVKVNNVSWTRTWWTFAGESVTEYSAEAKRQLGSWDSQFDDDYAAWLASLPPADLPPAP